MKTILITGCNRGIGFGLVKHLCENYGQMENIFATCRNPQNAQVSVNRSTYYDYTVATLVHIARSTNIHMK